jgi:LmbE family N-acetylglucosaminyl deacetylase
LLGKVNLLELGIDLINMSEKILVIAPHGDDEVLGVGGTIAKHAKEGDSVFVCVVTGGKPAVRYKGSIEEIEENAEEYRQLADSETTRTIREEAFKAHDLLGVACSYFLGFRAVHLESVAKYKINKAILDCVLTIQPDVVYLPHVGDIHIDHQLVANAAMVALRPCGGTQCTRIYAYETLSETEWSYAEVTNSFVPNVWNDISGFLNLKLEAMSCYQSQLKTFPHPRSLEALKALALFRGSNMGMRAAEAFRLVRFISR